MNNIHHILVLKCFGYLLRCSIGAFIYAVANRESNPDVMNEAIDAIFAWGDD